MKLTFLGGAGTVTGSKILLETKNKKLLIDCGLFQGLKELRLKNRDLLPFDPNDLDCVFLTHAHLDHSGYLPILIKNGYSGKIMATTATKALSEIILLDSGKIQEEDASRSNKYSYAKHKPAKPLYTINDAKAVIPHFQTCDLNKWYLLSESVKFKFLNSGHILGSAFILLDINGSTFLFSGDIGRKNPILLNPHHYIKKVDYLIIESTYGNRFHENMSITDLLLKYINYTYAKGGILIIPTFSVERAQEIIYLLSLLKDKNLLPKEPIYLDSPMGVRATKVYFKFKNQHKLTDQAVNNMLNTVKLVSDIDTSKAIVSNNDPKIVMAGSGMITGGRVLHYLDKYISDKKNTILVVGYQAEGTRGRALIEGEKEIKFFGKYHEIKAEIFKINAFSGHADQTELLEWMEHFKKPPKLTIINHGEPHQSQALRTKINTSLKWNCTVAVMNKAYDLY
jgi:metallo-beta-lactamase family protein